MAMVIAAFSLSCDRLIGAPPFAEPWTGCHDEAARISGISWRCGAGAPGCGGGGDVRPHLSSRHDPAGGAADRQQPVRKGSGKVAGRAWLYHRKEPDLGCARRDG